MNNNEAWEAIFKANNVISKIEEEGYYIISSKLINQYRESRLMAKIDHLFDLPAIFKKNHLSILPLARGLYVIGRFDIHYSVNYDFRNDYYEIVIPDWLKDLETLNYRNITSEASALNFAFHAGIVDRLLDDEEKVCFSVSGRMSTGSFNFKIKDSLDNKKIHKFQVNDSQCEIDGGFESKKYFAIIEVKNSIIDDFCIRQLYYPYY